MTTKKTKPCLVSLYDLLSGNKMALFTKDEYENKEVIKNEAEQLTPLL